MRRDVVLEGHVEHRQDVHALPQWRGISTARFDRGSLEPLERGGEGGGQQEIFNSSHFWLICAGKEPPVS